MAEQQFTREELAESERRLFALSRQLDTMARNGTLFDLECPYCGHFTSPGKDFCCAKMARALNALLDAREKFSPEVARRMKRHEVN